MVAFQTKLNLKKKNLKLALLEVINYNRIKLSPINYTLFEVKYFLKNILQFSGVCLHVKYGHTCKIFFFNHKNIYKKFYKNLLQHFTKKHNVHFPHIMARSLVQWSSH